MSSLSVGLQLRQARESRGLSLEQVAQITRIRLHYLQAMEAGELNRIPSVPQARGFLRTYASFLGLPAENLLKNLNGEPPADAESTPAQAKPRAAKPAKASPELPPVGETPAGEAAAPISTVPQGAVATQTPVTAAPVGEVDASERIFREVGATLHHQRDLLGLSLDDVERQTHLRRHYLVALEEGRLRSLPSPVQGRGMLSNYAAFLGLDTDVLLLRFAEGLQARLEAVQAEQVESRPKTRPRTSQASKARLPLPLRRFLSSDLLIGGTLAIFLVVFMLWGAIRIFSLNSSRTASPTAPSIADVLLASPVPTMTPSPGAPTLPSGAVPLGEATATLEGQLPITGPVSTAEGGGVQVYVNVQQRAWMRVLTDGEVVFEGRVLPGTAYTYQGEEEVEIVTGNGAALQIFFNNQYLGALGSFGQIVDRIFTASGVATPTPTITPTASPTPKRSPTPPGTQPGAAGTPALP